VIPAVQACCSPAPPLPDTAWPCHQRAIKPGERQATTVTAVTRMRSSAGLTAVTGQIPKLIVRVRFSSPAPVCAQAMINDLAVASAHSQVSPALQAVGVPTAFGTSLRRGQAAALTARAFWSYF
jgi:hypothetical protein